MEVVRSIYTAWEKGDFSSTEWADPDIEFQLPSERPVHGVAAMGQAWGGWLQAWDDIAVTPQAFHEEGNYVVGIHHFRGKGKRSGIPAEGLPGACVFTLEQDKVVRLTLHSHEQDALEAAGLSE